MGEGAGGVQDLALRLLIAPSLKPDTLYEPLPFLPCHQCMVHFGSFARFEAVAAAIVTCRYTDHDPVSVLERLCTKVMSAQHRIAPSTRLITINRTSSS